MVPWLSFLRFVNKRTGMYIHNHTHYSCVQVNSLQAEKFSNTQQQRLSTRTMAIVITENAATHLSKNPDRGHYSIKASILSYCK